MSIVLDRTPEQQQILSAVRKLLVEQFPLARLRGPQRHSPDAARLSRLAELGVFGLASDEALGGAGLSITEEVLVFVELGRHLVSPSALARSLGARLAAHLGHTELAAQLIAGAQGMALAHPLAGFDIAQMDGVEVQLCDAFGSPWALLWNDQGMGLLRTDALGLTPVAATDRALELQRAVLTPASLVGWVAASVNGLPRQAQLLQAAQWLGMAQATRDMAVEYAKIRTQFGRAIGSFQAIKHRCANMAIHAEVLGAQLMLATQAQRYGWADAQFQVDACRLLAAPYALANARSNIQVHGGMGFSAECDAHVYLLRAHLHQPSGSALGAMAQRLLLHRAQGRNGDPACA